MSKPDAAVTAYVASLREKPTAGLFNPWYEVDPVNDASSESPTIRREQLTHYLNVRRGRARLVLVAEAIGYQGGHFSGMAMTSERILLGHMRDKGVTPDDVLPGLVPRRTSRAEVKSLGFSEPTATVVWGALLAAGLAGTGFVLWNSLPWHPYQAGAGMLSNRTPTPAEMTAAPDCTHRFLALFPGAEIVAVGRKSEETLATLGIASTAVRHPANGGASTFRAQIAELVQTRGLR